MFFFFKGKTSLVRALRSTSDNFEFEQTELTDGISIGDWSIGLDDGTQLTFSIWDFGKKK
jgi:hypothetical protein